MASFNADSKCPDCCGNKTAVAPFKIMCRHATPFVLSPRLTLDHDLACGDMFEAFDMFGRDAVFDPNVSFAMLYNVKSASAPSVALPKARCFDDDEADEEDVTDDEEEEEEVAVCSNVNNDKSSSSLSSVKSRM